jgi:uncharacterized protein (DUF1697 family)
MERAKYSAMGLQMIQYAAFLRGINVGGHRTMNMAELRGAFEGMGYCDVRTVLASGNVVFATAEEAAAVAGSGPGDTPSDTATLVLRIGEGLNEAFGYPIAVVVREVAHLQHLVDSDPFTGLDDTPGLRLNVTFLAHSPEDGAGLDPKTLPGHVLFLEVGHTEILSAIRLSPGWGTPEMMALLEREFGRGLTTRTWSTVKKVAGR